jgi:hypothetical protein
MELMVSEESVEEDSVGEKDLREGKSKLQQGKKRREREMRNEMRYPYFGLRRQQGAPLIWMKSLDQRETSSTSKSHWKGLS